jgi:hypothetical protein
MLLNANTPLTVKNIKPTTRKTPFLAMFPPPVDID